MNFIRLTCFYVIRTQIIEYRLVVLIYKIYKSYNSWFFMFLCCYLCWFLFEQLVHNGDTLLYMLML